MATRHQVRQSVISLLYAFELNSQNNVFVDEILDEKKIRNEQKNFTLNLYNGILDNLNNIDETLNSFLNDNQITALGTCRKSYTKTWSL